ncbi:hypothetical protein HanRHA438_Chr11g0514901 [Helianthus annuus]|nr:hypothetical protein HanHA300_Chr11g0412381 [Helianthus annuus]KAJ0510428.1 hypothetical protein HanIR_Chr11g0540711 [Helianthus annuus]KAJ0518312.1 hypothetical protein HanHA89_Chr11g0436041 [Helianthus annuus]KAJ0686346.1 hypothetical protein HanLR1_Chr11g0413721 [Helianthus annuus]KAJ0690168.1 hypothetical protein HanOQP8_Chr11g0414831 [Helianthus annuus]
MNPHTICCLVSFFRPTIVIFIYICRDKNGDDAFVVIRDRKVQVSEGTSIYAQCRSWLKNGVTLEKQYPDCVKSLPKPLPALTVEARKEDDLELEEEVFISLYVMYHVVTLSLTNDDFSFIGCQNPENVDHLSAKELLQLHVNHAKKVRARLRNQRLQRIERYKDRLALLLPAVADQQPKNDPAS